MRGASQGSNSRLGRLEREATGDTVYSHLSTGMNDLTRSTHSGCGSLT